MLTNDIIQQKVKFTYTESIYYTRPGLTLVTGPFTC